IKPKEIFGDAKQQQKIVRSLKKNQSLKAIETTFRKKNGKEFWGVMNISLLKHEGKSDYYVGTLRDITKEKEAELQLLESRNFLNNIIITVAAPIFVKDKIHRWIIFNDKFCELLGRTRKQIIGKTDADIFTKAEAAEIYKIDNEV